MEETILKDELLNKVDESLLNEISDIENIKKGAFNIRKNGQGIERKNTKNIEIIQCGEKLLYMISETVSLNVYKK